MSNKKVHLVLGSGGARGIAHIGVIEVLEEKGYEIISITGCSMGAVVGGIYAAGYQKEYRDWMLTLTKPMLFNIMDFTLSLQGFLKGERIFSIIRDVTGPQEIDKFNIPFTAVAADMVTNKEVHYRSGDLYKALRASIAIPGVFTPVIENGQLLVDGGVLNPLPLNLVQKKDNELILAVNLNGPGASPLIPEEEGPGGEMSLWQKFKALQGGSKPGEQEVVSIPDYSLRELLVSSYRMTQNRLTSLMIEAYPPDILVEIPRNTCTTFEFYKAKSLVELGRTVCLKALSLN